MSQQALSIKQLPKFSDMRASFARQNLAYYSRYMGYKNAPFHDRWYNLLQPANNPLHFSPLQEHPNALKRFHLEAPRKHGKSQCVAINYPAWLIGNNHDVHITIVSKTASLAQQSLGEIKAQIEHDSRYRELFGDLQPQNPQAWTNNQIYIKRMKISKFPTIHATGLSGPLTGGGSDLIIADDIIDQDNVVTRLQTDKAYLWFRKVLLTTLFPWGAVLAIGTRWSYDDLYSHLIEDWQNEVLQAITNEAEYVKGNSAKVLWKRHWPIKRLEEKRKDLGSIIFNCQYQNDPSGTEGAILKADWLHKYEKLPSELDMYAGVDPALGEGDLHSIASFGYERDKKQGYLVDVWAKQCPLSELFEILRKKHSVYNYLKIFLEDNVFQKLLINQPELQGLPVVGTTTHHDKASRFISMSSHFEAERILVNPLLIGKSEFYSEWMQFPKGTYDDALDGADIVTRNVIRRGAKATTTYLDW